eukprot:10265256-Alexandrium_andersonii.AAC.1
MAQWHLVQLATDFRPCRDAVCVGGASQAWGWSAPADGAPGPGSGGNPSNGAGAQPQASPMDG